MTDKQRIAFEQVTRAALTLRQCEGCGPPGGVALAEQALHVACLAYARLFPRGAGEGKP